MTLLFEILSDGAFSCQPVAADLDAFDVALADKAPDVAHSQTAYSRGLCD